jgi:hypothetical protein
MIINDYERIVTDWMVGEVDMLMNEDEREDETK